MTTTTQDRIQHLAAVIWMHLPYDHESNQVVCPDARTLEAAMRIAIERTEVSVEEVAR